MHVCIYIYIHVYISDLLCGDYIFTHILMTFCVVTIYIYYIYIYIIMYIYIYLFIYY